MNKHAHRLVFDRRRGMCVPAHEHARSTGKSANGQSRAVTLSGAFAGAITGALALACAPQVSLADMSRSDGAVTTSATSRQEAAVAGAAATRSVSSLVQSALNASRSNLPTYTASGKWSLNLGDYTNPTLSADGKVMTLLQTGKTIVLNWDSFDVAEGYKIRFDQVEGGRALNRVHNANPSLINGVVSASGDILLENTAGIIFGKNARVDARSFTATALRISDEVFQKGLRSMRKGEAVFGGDNAAVDGFVAVQKGAEIKSLAGGDVILVAPRVVNEGKIETPEGQAILAAGKTVYLYAPLDLAQRGLLVAVDNFSDETLLQIKQQVDDAVKSGNITDSDRAEALGTAENAADGKVLADKGTINLVGAAIRQKGQLTATTAVKGKNGAIFLTAMKETALVNNPTIGDRIAKNMGTVELAAGSITEVLPSTEGLLLSDADKAAGKIGVRPDEVMRVRDKPIEPKVLPSTATDEQKQAYAAAKQLYEADLKVYESQLQQASDTFYRSRIDIIGKDITLRAGAVVQAPAGEVNIKAASNWDTAYLREPSKLGSQTIPDDSRLVMEAGAKVDVSGLNNLYLPASRHQLEGRLFSIELADATVQRDGVLYRANLLADARRFITVGDVTGLYNQFRYSAAEYATTGGLLNMQSQGAMLVDKNALIDFSGGMVTYDAGPVVSSTVFRDGAISRIENANRNIAYDALVSNPTESNPEELLRRGLVLPAQTTSGLVPEQKVGMSAGVATLSAPVMSLGATLDGSVRMSEVQRIATEVAERDTNSSVVSRPSALTAKPYLYASLKPTAGLLVLGQKGIVSSDTDIPAQAQQSITVTANVPNVPTLLNSWSNEAWQDVLAQVGTDLKVSDAQINQAGLAGLSLYAIGINIGNPASADAPKIRLAEQGSFTAIASQSLGLDGTIRSAGGTIDLKAYNDISLTRNAVLDVAGTTRDERFQPLAAGEGVARNGGTVTLKAGGSIALEAGSQVDVSGSVWRNNAGTLVQGKAGTVDMTVNEQATSDQGRPLGTLQLSGTLSAFDGSAGGTLKLSRLAAVVVGGPAASPTDFVLASGLYADRGFGKLDVVALGGVTIAAGAQLKPQLVNSVPVAARLAGVAPDLYELKTLEAGRRQPFSLSLKADVSPPTAGTALSFGLPQGANLTVGEGALVDVGLGGSIQLQAGGSLEMAGSLVAKGGNVSLGLLGGRGAASSTSREALGYLPGQAIHLAAGSLIDVSGASKSYQPDGGLTNREVGDVLAGGTITLGGADGTPVRGQLRMDALATLRLNGASALLNRNAGQNKTRISAAAGTLNIMSTDGFQLLGNIQAQAPDASVAGGTLNMALSQETREDLLDSGATAYPSGEDAGKRSIRITDSRANAQALAASGLKFGEGVVAAEQLNGAGFDRIGLRADESVQLNAGAHLKAGDARTRLQSVVLNTSVIEVADGAAHTIEAHYVGVGPKAKVSDGLPLKLPQVTAASERAEQGQLGGTGTLNVQAGLIEVSGDTAVLGVNQLTLDARLSAAAATALGRRNGEIRFVGQTGQSLASDKALKGQLSFTGNLNLVAGQVYATTLSDINIKGFGPNGANGGQLTIAAPEGGSTSQTPLSALAKLTLRANSIALDGTVRQPFGTIDAEAPTLTLSNRAALSVAADGTRVPVGTTLNQTTWVYGTQGTVSTAGTAADLAPANNATVIDRTALPLNKQIKLNGDTLSLSSQSAVDAQAGGDILAWEFKQGVGGTTDTYLRKDVFAILPSYNYDFSPFDTEMRATTQKLGSGLKVGDQVTLTTNNGVLGAGTYTLMDARYGILPGAVLVSASSLNVTAPLVAAVKYDDGSVLVSGQRTSTGTAQNGGGDARLVFTLEPEATVKKKSEILLTSGNDFQAQRAKRSGEPLAQPGDAGRISLASTQAFDWAARFNLKGDAKNKLSAGQFDLAMPNMVVQANPSQSVPTGSSRVSLTQLNALGAESILLGGERSTQADGSVLVERKANSVAFQADADVNSPANVLSTPGELLAVVKNTLTVDNGLAIQSTGADTGAQRRYVLKGDGAALQVGNLADTDISAQGVTGSNVGQLVVGSNEAAGKVKLKGQSVALDATQGLSVASATEVDALTLSLGGQRLAIGQATAPLGANTVEVSGNLLAAANRSERLKLRAYVSIDLLGSTQLGTDKLKLLTLDAPQLLGGGQATDTAVVRAQEVLLTNTSGRTAPEPLETSASSLRIEAAPVLADGRTGGLTVGTSLAANQAAATNAGQRWAFATTTLESLGDIVFDGRGQTVAQGDLTLRTARVTATSSADQTVRAAGKVVVERAAGGQTLNESTGVAGKLNVVADRIEQKGLIDIEAGRLSLQGRGVSGQTDTVVFAEGSETRVDGRLRPLSDTYAVASSGGYIVAEAQQGRMVVNGLLSASAPVMPEGVSGDNPYAGSITLKATGVADAQNPQGAGAVVLGNNARIDLSAALGKGGSLQVDTRQLVLDDAARSAAAANSQVAQTGIDKLLAISANARAGANPNVASTAHRAVDIRVREGDVRLNTTVVAEKIIITADGGKLDLGFNSLLNATAPQGGDVRLYAKNDLTVETGAQVLAQSTRDGANGGDVLLASSQGQVLLGKATIKADSASDAADGRITLRAGQTQDAGGAYTGDVKVGLLAAVSTDAPDAALTLQAGRIDIEAVRTYEDDPLANASTWHTGLQTGASSGQSWGLSTLQEDANAFATESNKAQVLGKLGLTGRSQAHVKAGVELQALGNFTLGNGTDELTLNAVRPGAEPINLTVRAAGNINANSTVSDGFNGAKDAALAALDGDAASLRFAAGADLMSANVLATQDDALTGHFTLAGGKFIRTTAGSIDVSASGDVRLMAPSLVTPSAIYVAGRLSPLAANERFSTSTTKTAADTAATAYANARFTERGGHLAVAAGGNVGSYFFEGGTLNPRQVTQMTGNYFYHGGNPNNPLINQRTPVAWWTGLNAFRQGLGSFGGGNISVSAGGHASNLAVVAPTNARTVLVLDDSGQATATQLKELNGGNIEVLAGGNVDGGVYFLGRGQGRIAAGGNFNRGADGVAATAVPSLTDVYEPGAMLGLMAGAWDVSAVKDLNLSYVFNPTVMPFKTGAKPTDSASGLSAASASVYFTYADDAKVSLTALQGDVNWQTNTQSLNGMHKTTSSTESITLGNSLTSSSSYLASVLPSRVSMTSLEGDVLLDTRTRGLSNKPESLLVMPTAVSDVNIYAGNNLNLQANVQLLDAGQAMLGLPSASRPALLAGNAGSGATSFNLAGLNTSLSPTENASDANANGLRLSATFDTLAKTPISDLGQTNNANVARFYSGQDIIFFDTGYLRSNRPTELVAGRDLITPSFVGQNFTQDDLTLVAAGRDIVGNAVSMKDRQLIIGGPGAMRVEAGRDILLNQSIGVLAVANQINSALPEQAAKITLSAGNARTVNVPKLLGQYGSDPALRTAMNSALLDSQLPIPEGRASWADASFDEALVAFSTLKKSRQADAVNRYLNAQFVARYLPALSGKPDSYYRTDAFLRLKQEALWQQVIGLAGQAVAIAVSSDAEEEAKRAQQRKDLFADAAKVADLAGYGVSFDRVGNLDLSKAKVHNLGVGGGTFADRADDSQGGIDVMAAGQVTVGLPSAANAPAGFINFKGGSFRSLTGRDFLVGDQKVIVVGKGNLFIYTTDGSIDSGKGSNTSVAKPLPTRVFNAATGKVDTVGQPPTAGSGFQSVEPPEGVATKVGLYAPNGEIRALDAFIKGSKVEIAAPKVVGADNIANASGVAPPPPPAVNLSLAPKASDTAAASKAADAAGTKARDKQTSSLLTVELLGFGDGGAADTSVTTPRKPCPANDPNCER